MRSIWRLFIFTIFTLTITSLAFSQSVFQAGGHFTLGFPQNEFKEHIDAIGIGVTGHFAYRFPRTHFLIGATGGFLIYGSEKREEPFSDNISDVFVDVITTNSIILGHLLFRIQPQRGVISPYIDGLFGFSYLTTDTRVEDQWDHEEIARSNNYDDITLSYGAGAGLMIKIVQLAQKESRTHGGPRAIYIDVGVRFLKGGEAEYLKKDSIRRQNGIVLYDVEKSRTDILNTFIGVIVAF
jgi:hypothetical protein